MKAEAAAVENTGNISRKRICDEYPTKWTMASRPFNRAQIDVERSRAERRGHICRVILVHGDYGVWNLLPLKQGTRVATPQGEQRIAAKRVGD